MINDYLANGCVFERKVCFVSWGCCTDSIFVQHTLTTLIYGTKAKKSHASPDCDFRRTEPKVSTSDELRRVLWPDMTQKVFTERRKELSVSCR